MPIPAPPSVYHCSDCGWHKTVPPKSDNLVTGYDCFTECPKCGSKALKRTPAGSLDTIISKFGSLFK